MVVAAPAEPPDGTAKDEQDVEASEEKGGCPRGATDRTAKDRRSNCAPLNSAVIPTQPATNFYDGISTPEFRRDDATLRYDVTLRPLSLS